MRGASEGCARRLIGGKPRIAVSVDCRRAADKPPPRALGDRHSDVRDAELSLATRGVLHRVRRRFDGFHACAVASSTAALHLRTPRKKLPDGDSVALVLRQARRRVKIGANLVAGMTERKNAVPSPRRAARIRLPRPRPRARAASLDERTIGRSARVAQRPDGFACAERRPGECAGQIAR